MKIAYLLLIIALIATNITISAQHRLITMQNGLIKEYHTTIYDLRLNSDRNYNMGYRAGKLEGVAELVECDHITEVNTLRMYSDMSRQLQQLGELNNSPFPCNLSIIN